MLFFSPISHLAGCSPVRVAVSAPCCRVPKSWEDNSQIPHILDRWKPPMLLSFQWTWKKLYISIYDPLLKMDCTLYSHCFHNFNFVCSISVRRNTSNRIYPLFGMVVTYAYCRFAVELYLCKRCNVMMHIHVVGDVYITQQLTLLQRFQTYNDL